MNNSYWLEREVTKLYASFLDNNVLSNWVADEEDPEAESRALDTLELVGIIKSPAYFEGADYRIADLRAGDALSAPNRLINDFDYDRFMRFCETNRLNPTAKGVTARLEIIDQVQPVIYVGQEKYAYEALDSGTTVQMIVAYAYKQADKDIGLDELRASIPRNQLSEPKVNIRQIFKGNVFNRKDGTLRSFAEIGTRSFLLKKSAMLTPSEVVAIKKVGSKKD